MDNTQRALEDLKVVDLTHYVAGPYCTKMFADFGASVIKVEKPGEGDGARRLGPFPGDVPDPEASGLFLNLNTNKLGITLNLKTDTGQDILIELIRSADIIVENFRPGVMDNLGLGWDTLHSVNPRLVMTSISNFGQTGPYRDYKASDLIQCGLGGLSYLTGDADREPLKGPQSQSQYQAGLFGFMATMCAIIAREWTGEGQRIDVSIMESVSAVLTPHVLRAVAAGTDQKKGDQVPVHPSKFFRCRDGHIYLFAPGDRFEDLVHALGLDPAITEDPRFSTGFARFQNADSLEELMGPQLMDWDRETLFDLLKDWGLPAGMALSVDELFTLGHLRERGFFVDVEHPRAGTLKYAGAPFRMTETPWKIRFPAPVLGQHNCQVLCERLGYAKTELVRLRQTGII
ncbi:MAG: CoA transferase [Desulfobacteraceae bacterium]|nr:CoA transferase [Desulfobacteraceae bacterium]